MDAQSNITSAANELLKQVWDLQKDKEVTEKSQDAQPGLPYATWQ